MCVNRDGCMKARKIFKCKLAALLSVAMLLFAGAGLAQTPPQNPQAHATSPKATQSSEAAFNALKTRADAARDAEKLDDAAKLYRKALAINPGWPEGWWSLGTIDYDSARYAESMEDFRRLLKLAPNDGTTHLMLGLSEFELGAYDDARKHLALAWKLGIQDAKEMEPVLLYHQVLLELQAKQFEGALDTTAHMIRMGMSNDEVIVATGMAMLRRPLDQLPPKTSHDYEVVQRVGLAESLKYTETYQRAQELYLQVLKDEPDFPHIHYAYGHFLMEINQPDESINQFKEELKRDPKNYNAMLKISSLYYHNDSVTGIPYAEEAVKMVPTFPMAHFLLGALSLEAGDVDRAIKELEIARKMLPKEPQFAFVLANAYAKAHRKEDSLRERQAFVALKDAEKQDDSQTQNNENNQGLHLDTEPASKEVH